MGFAAQAASASLTIVAATCFMVAVLVGIGLALILSLIPSYLTTRNITPVAEKYCISNLQFNTTLNTTTPYGGFNLTYINISYPLSEACYRILQSYKKDSLLAACLISNCSFTGSVLAAPVINSTDVSCYAEIYYSARCTDQSPTSGLNSPLNSSSTTSACRKKRMTNINQALGASAVQYTNVPSLIIAGIVVPIQSIFGLVFSSYSQVGAYYCAVVNQTTITAAVNAQASG